MIFPSIRQSELEKRVAEKRAAFENSRDALVEEIHQKTRPLTFIKDHPKLVIGSVFTFFSGSKLLLKLASFVFSKKKKSIFWKLIRAGWVWKLVGLITGTAVKKNRAKLEKLGSDLILNLFKSKR